VERIFQKFLNEYQLEEVAKVEEPLITEEEVKAAHKEMKKGNVAGPTRVTIDLLQATGMVGLRELTNIMNDNIYGEKIPEDWKCSSTIPIYKGKGDAMVCGKYSGVTLLEHGMKVYEYVLEKRMRDMVDIGNYQLRFCQGRPTAGAMFILRMLQKKYSQKNRKLYHVFVDLEKDLDLIEYQGR